MRAGASDSHLCVIAAGPGSFCLTDGAEAIAGAREEKGLDRS